MHTLLLSFAHWMKKEFKPPRRGEGSLRDESLRRGLGQQPQRSLPHAIIGGSFPMSA